MRSGEGVRHELRPDEVADDSSRGPGSGRSFVDGEVRTTVTPEPDPHEMIRLTDAQRRHLSSMIRRLVNETQEWIDDWERSGLSTVEATRSRRTLESVLQRARLAATQLSIDLPEPAGDPGRRLSAWASAWWSTVLSSRPEALRAWGEVDPGVPARVGPIVQDLAELLLQLATHATHGTADGTG